MADPLTKVESVIDEVGRDVLKSFDVVKKLLLEADAEALKALKIAREELPIMAEALAAAAGVLTVAIPGAGGLAAVLSTASNMINNVDKYVVTTDGVLMDPAQAARIGLKISPTPATDEQKRMSAVEMVKSLHPMKPELADNAAHLAVQIAVAKEHHVEPARRKAA
jgi:hypothetical protein